ncbi:MAG: hypothetical protein AB7F35_30165 [Acetobacteraceae bacterium]
MLLQAVIMIVTKAMIDAAWWAEFDYHQKGRTLDERFIPTPDSVISAMLKGALAPMQQGGALLTSRIGGAKKPSRR